MGWAQTKGMDTDWLEDFLALVECGGFSRAADRRAVSQPSFSRRIRSLEDWVGAVLVDRSSHTLRLTPAGERFRVVAEEALRRLQFGREEARATAKASSETLRFASTHVLSLTFFPAWLRRLEAEEPTSVTVELTADNMAACERLGADFRSIQLGEDVLLPVKSPDLVVEGELADAPQLCFTADSGMGRILSAAWRAEGRPEPSQPIFASHLASVLTVMAKEGRGIAWTALSLVEEDFASGKLVRAAPPEQDVPIEIRLWRPRARQAPAAEQLWSRLLKSRAQQPA